MRVYSILFLICCSVIVHANEFTTETPVYPYHEVNRFPHDTNAFTQGLLYVDDKLYESTGLHGQSTLREVDLLTGAVRKGLSLPGDLFGEGLTLWNDKLIQLTWRSGLALFFDKNTFQFEKKLRYRTEGWGLTHNDKHLIMSDGSAHLYFLDPETFEVQGRLTVRDKGEAVTYLNELEYIKGEIYANVWQTTRIARINPKTGQVLSWIDLSKLAAPYQGKKGMNVLNGIAYDKKNARLFITGKRWPYLFEIAPTSPLSP